LSRTGQRPVLWDEKRGKIMSIDDFSTGPHTAALTPGADRNTQTGTPPTAQACSFCGKKYHEVTKLIAGPGVFICTECVELCNEIWEDEGSNIAT
jgi:hypothetical protein